MKGHRQQRSPRNQATWSVAAALLSAAACSSEAPSDSEPLVYDDAGQHEGQLDAATSDAATPDDAGSDAAAPSADAGLISECQGDVLSVESARVRGRSFSASAVQNRLDLAIFEPTCGGTRADNSAQGLALHRFQTTGEPDAEQPLINLDQDSCFITSEPAMLATADGAYGLFFGSTLDGSYDLFYLDSADLAAPRRITTDSLHGESAISATFLAGLPLVAFSREAVDAAANAAADIVTSRPGYVSRVVVPESAGFHATQTALTSLAGADASHAGALAWVSDEPTKPGAFLQVLDDQGAASGAVSPLTQEHSEGVSLAAGKQGGAVAYAIATETAQQARFRVVNVDGSVGQEVELTANNERVRDLALAHYSTGYVLAYRWLGAGEDQANSIRLMFLDPKGRVGRTRFVADAAGGNGVQIQVAQDGRLWVTWEESELIPAGPDGGVPQVAARIRVARLECP